MTKPEIDPTTKCSLNVEDTGKIGLEQIGRMLETSMPAIHILETVPTETMSFTENPATADTSPKARRMDFAERELFDLEAGSRSEKVLKIDLDLYQMEDY